MANEEKRILAVSDLVTMIKALDVAFERMGYRQITKVKDEREALALAPGEATISGEELLCYSLFGNLLRNAIEASPAKGKVLIESLSAAPHVIRILNSGAIPEEIRAHFFDKYVTSGKSSGTGLGTYSAKLLTEIQGGSIGFTTSEETGTTIEVTLTPHSPQ